MQFLLGIDAGTTSLKAVLFDLDGNPVGSALQEYQLITPAPDTVELDVETYWRVCCMAVREVMADSQVDPRNIAALSISSQGETLIPVNALGKPLRRAIVWLDNRAAAEAADIERKFGAEHIFQITGQPEVVPTWPACKILWLRQREPEIFRQTTKFLLVEEYLLYKLSGRFVAEKSVQTSSLLFDIRRKHWWPEMLRFLFITENQLGDLLEPGAVVGRVSESGSADTGLSTQTLVVTGAMDQMAGAVGAGNVTPGLVSETTGGALAICATLPELMLDPQRRIPTHYHAIKDMYCLLPYGQIGGMALRWFRDTFGQAEQSVANENGLDAYNLLGQIAEQSQAGCEGLVFLPHLSGAASPEFDTAARGVFYGISLQHGRAHFIRAIMESIAYMLKKNLDVVEQIGGPVVEIRAMGGGSRSKLWLGIKSDILQKIVVPVEASESACLGVALLAGVASGVFSNLEEGLKRMVKPGEPLHPNPANKEIYQIGYQEYLDLYESLSPMFKRSQQRRSLVRQLEQA